MQNCPHQVGDKLVKILSSVYQFIPGLQLRSKIIRMCWQAYQNISHMMCVFDLGKGVENAPAGSGRAVAAGIQSNAFRSLSRAQHAARTRAHTAQNPGLATLI